MIVGTEQPVKASNLFIAGPRPALMWVGVLGVCLQWIVLPLFTPLAIFGGGAIMGLAEGLDWTSGLLFLSAYSLVWVALGPFAMAWACRNFRTRAETMASLRRCKSLRSPLRSWPSPEPETSRRSASACFPNPNCWSAS